MHFNEMKCHVCFISNFTFFTLDVNMTVGLLVGYISCLKSVCKNVTNLLGIIFIRGRSNYYQTNLEGMDKTHCVFLTSSNSSKPTFEELLFYCQVSLLR